VAKRTPKHAVIDGIDVYYPRYLTLGNAGEKWLGGRLLYWAALPTARKLHRQKPFDIVHVHMLPRDGHAGLLTAKALGVPCALTVHGTDIFHYFIPGKEPWKRNKDIADGVDALMEEFERADTVVSVSPSYWADVPGQFKAFIDRCTPWCNTHEPHARLSAGKLGYAVALRTGPGLPECERILGTIRHFYGHLEIEYRAGLALTGVEHRKDVEGRTAEILSFCEDI